MTRERYYIVYIPVILRNLQGIDPSKRFYYSTGGFGLPYVSSFLLLQSVIVQFNI